MKPLLRALAESVVVLAVVMAACVAVSVTETVVPPEIEMAPPVPGAAAAATLERLSVTVTAPVGAVVPPIVMVPLVPPAALAVVVRVTEVPSSIEDATAA